MWPFSKRDDRPTYSVYLLDQFKSPLTKTVSFKGSTNTKALTFPKVDEDAIVTGYVVIDVRGVEIRKGHVVQFNVARNERPVLAPGQVRASP